MKDRQKLLILNKILYSVCILSLLSTGFVFAKESNVLKIGNILQTDYVDVDLKHNTKILDDSSNSFSIKELDYSKDIKIDPGSDISIIPTIQNKGTDCFIRVFVSIPKESNLNINNFSGISDDWKYNENDGYFYYTKPVKTNEIVTLYDTLNIPLDYEKDEGNFSIPVTVDAIQSKNFEPDFSSDKPWGNVKIQQYVEGNVYTYEKTTDSDSDQINITFNGNSVKLISNKDDFFTNIPKLVPGDYYQDEIILNNNFDKNVSLYFEAHPNISNNEIQNDLLDKISLEILDENGNKIFNGKLSQDIENMKIIELKANESSKLSFKIYFDIESNNAYAHIDNLVNWYFNTSFSDDKPTNNLPQTGDESNILTYGIISLISGVLIIYTNKKLKENQ